MTLVTPVDVAEGIFLLSEIELREVAESVVEACYGQSVRLGVVADWWVCEILGESRGQAPLQALAAVLGCTVEDVFVRLDEVRAVGSTVFENETGRPSPW